MLKSLMFFHNFKKIEYFHFSCSVNGNRLCIKILGSVDLKQVFKFNLFKFSESFTVLLKSIKILNT